uniref:Targeting protein for Xklp2 homolog n=1 Tax=Cacopsylla melanoneura TaxID=428564 RepID=A0A8D8YB72_9HEMI
MSETEKFEYNAPTYVDFVNGFDDSDGVDKFFETSMKQESEDETLDSTITMNPQLLMVPDMKVENEFTTPDKHSTPEPPRGNSMDHLDAYIDQENLTPNVKATCKTPNPQNGRRSRILFEALEGLSITGSLKTHKMVTRMDPRTPLLELRGRTVPRNVSFAFHHSNADKKLHRQILFKDETDDITKQIENLCVSNTTQQSETKQSEVDSLGVDKTRQSETDNLGVDKTRQSETDNLGVDKIDDTLSDSSVTENMEPALNETVTINSHSDQIKSPLHCISNANQNKRKSALIDSPSQSSMHCNKYISLAESALKCNGMTKSMQENRTGPQDFTRYLTQAKTPNLMTKSRVRPSNILSHSQEEDKILSEIRGQKYKAQPIPKGLFNPPKLGVRKLAVPKYNFGNETAKSVTTENQQMLKVPRRNINFKKDNVKVIESDEKGMTVINKEVGHKGVGICNGASNKLKITKAQPFSFYEKERERFRQKEERIKKIIEDEKKLAIFHANPVPGFVRRERKKWTSSQASLNMTACSHSTTCSVTSDHFVFRAKSPSVLHQKPFVPRKSMKPPSQIDNFTLHTEERSAQRDVYEHSKKQRELEIQLYLQEQERLKREREEAEYRESRKSRVHKPLPMPNFK